MRHGYYIPAQETERDRAVHGDAEFAARARALWNDRFRIVVSPGPYDGVSVFDGPNGEAIVRWIVDGVVSDAVGSG